MTKNHDLAQQALHDRGLLPTILIGAAGTGKTYAAVGLAVEWLGMKNKKVLVTRPNVSFAQANGFLPGTEREKMEPWIRPIEQNFQFHGKKKGDLAYEEKCGRLSYMPLEYIQGLTWDDTLIIVDECQNMSFEQLKVFLTRTGKYSKVVLCGDIAQISPKFKGSGLEELFNMTKALGSPVNIIEFTHEDILRSPQCKQWIEDFDKWEHMKHG